MRLVLGEYSIPYPCPREKRRDPVGELWRVDDDALDALDVLEGVDEGMYVRVRLQSSSTRARAGPNPRTPTLGMSPARSPSRAAWETRRASPYPRTI